MTAALAIGLLAALFVVFGLFAPRGGEGRTCHGCPEEDGSTGGCEACPLTTSDSGPRKEEGDR